METLAKPWYTSKGVWGSLMAAIGSAVIFYNSVVPVGAAIPPEVAERIQDENTLIALVSAGAFVSAILAWVGRLAAKKPIAKSAL
jgi:hypothetical protein